MDEVISMSNSPLRVKSKEFAKQIVFLCKEIKNLYIFFIFPLTNPKSVL